LALKALSITGEVITTPYSFAATTHSLVWCGLTPVFCDIEEETFNIDAKKIESLITHKTTAILPVHVYGIPCDMHRIEKIVKAHGLKVIYDAAHAFGVQQDGCPILGKGDLSILSFHATKVFNTVEGGAIITGDEKTKEHVDLLKNFGIKDEVTVTIPGINAKMNEIQAAFGLLQLKGIEEEIAKRKRICEHYHKNLMDKKGLKCLQYPPSVKPNYSHFPVIIDQDGFGKTRDSVYHELRAHQIYARRYYYPLISRYPAYRNIPSASPENLPVAEKITKEILCLPIYGELGTDEVDRICDIMLNRSRTKIVG
jgi:dTDP-4-amino-4,6-dideoxygalactose transaminase